MQTRADGRRPREASLIGRLLQSKALLMIILANLPLDKHIIIETFTALLLMLAASAMLRVPVSTPMLAKMKALLVRSSWRPPLPSARSAQGPALDLAVAVVDQQQAIGGRGQRQRHARDVPRTPSARGGQRLDAPVPRLVVPDHQPIFGPIGTNSTWSPTATNWVTRVPCGSGNGGAAVQLPSRASAVSAT